MKELGNNVIVQGTLRPLGAGKVAKVWNRLFRAAASASPSPTAIATFEAPAGAAGRAVVFEALEGRQLMSVSLDSGGWTVVTPEADSRVVYVSSTSGRDSNTGLSPSSPVASIARGESLLRNNSADQLLLQRGDVWHEGLGRWTLSGRSEQQPLLVGAYGSGARPVLDTGLNSALMTGSSSHPEVDHLDLVGIDFEANGRDPSRPGYAAGATATGLSFTAKSNGILVEDCQVKDYTVNITVENYFGSVSNMTVRRSQVLDAYSVTGVHAEGLYSNGARGLTLEDNVFDHNGWSAVVPGAVPTIYNHDVYLSADNTGVVVRGNVISRASSHGLQARSGGIVQNNLFVDDAIAISYGLVNGSPMTAGGVSGDVSGNVILGGANIRSLTRGGGIEIGNTAPGGHTTVSNNLFADGNPVSMAAIELEAGQGVFNPWDAVGINDLTISGNLVYNWAQGISVMPDLQPGASGINGLNGLTVQGNAFQQITGSHIIQHMAPLSTGQEKFGGNVYDAAAPDLSWFNVQGNWTSLSAWAAKVEPGATAQSIAFPDASRTLGSYNAALGGGDSTAAFLAQARLQSSQDWQPQYTAAAAGSYVRAGFGMAGTSTTTEQPGATPKPTPAPTPTPAPAPKPTPAPTPTASQGGTSGTGSKATPPVVTLVAFRQADGKWPQHLVVQFSSDVGATLQASDLVVTGPHGVVPPSALRLYYDAPSHTASWEFDGLPGAALPKGTYHVTVLATHLHDAAGQHLDGNGDGKAGDNFNWSRTFYSPGAK